MISENELIERARCFDLTAWLKSTTAIARGYIVMHCTLLGDPNRPRTVQPIPSRAICRPCAVGAGRRVTSRLTFTGSPITKSQTSTGANRLHRSVVRRPVRFKSRSHSNSRRADRERAGAGSAGTSDTRPAPGYRPEVPGRPGKRNGRAGAGKTGRDDQIFTAPGDRCIAAYAAAAKGGDL